MPSSPRTASDAAELERSRLQFEKMTQTPVPKLILGLAAPTILSMLITSIYNLADTFFVGQLSTSASGAVGVVSSLMAIIQALGFMLGHGAGGIISRSLGSQDTHAATKFASTSFFTALTFGAVLTVLGLAALPDFMMLLGSTDTILPHACAYARPILIAAPLMMSSLVMNNILRYEGKASFAMIGLVTGGVLNIVLDPIFIFVFKMGVVGAAVATVIGQFCGCGLALYMNLRKNHDLHLRFRGFRPDWKIVGNIYAIGLPSVVMVAIGSVMTFCMNKILITYHSAKETAATAFGIYFKLNSFVFMPVFGLNNGVVPIVAYNYGAQNRRRMMETIKRSAIYASCIMVLGMAIFWAIPGTLVSIFNATETMKQVAVPALRIISLSFCTAGACIALGSSFQALGKSVYSMITSIIRQLVFLVPIAYVLARYGQSIGNDDLVWWCYPIAEIASLGVTMLFFLRVYRTVIAKVPLDGAPSLEELEAEQ